jgi:hypothetical protein
MVRKTMTYRCLAYIITKGWIAEVEKCSLRYLRAPIHMSGEVVVV